MGGFTREELAQRAGVAVDFIDRLVELRIVSPGEGNSPFSGPDVRTAHFVHGLEQGGVPLEAVGLPFEAAPFPSRYSTRRSGTGSVD